MIDFDNLPAEIDRLHSEAEDLRDLASITVSPEYAAELRQDATRLVRQAARLRAQIEEA
jgi:transaldolase